MQPHQSPVGTDVTFPSPVERADLALALALTILSARLYYATAPAVVNLDGLGYIKLLPHNFAAGHLLYMPLLRALTALCRGNGLLAGHLLSAGAAGLSVGVFHRCARVLLDRFGATVAACGLAVSYAVWVQGADVEAYACALAALVGVLALALAYRARPTTGRALTFGLALAGAVLFHLTHVLVTPFVIVWTVGHAPSRRRGLLDAGVACATGGAITIAGYAWATLGVRHTNLQGAIHWIATAGHGFIYEGSLLSRLADAVFGLAKSFVWWPYLYETDAAHYQAQLLLGLLALAAVLAVIAVGRRGAARLPWRSLTVWMGSYFVMALAFFGSDHERWIFVLPPLWLCAAAALASFPRPAGTLRATALITYLAVANAATAIGPARHQCWDRTRADAAAAPMHDGDLVLFPGHSWDEYIGFYTHTKIVPFPLAYYAGRDGNAAMAARLDNEVRAARARGARIWAARIFDSGADKDEDSRGFYELQSLGLPRPAVRALLARFTAVPIATVEPQVTIWRLDDR